MGRALPDQARQRALQQRTLSTRGKIVSGAIEVLGGGGVSAVTHRSVAKAAGVSLATTTYHFANLAEILKAASGALLSAYLESFRRLADRLRANNRNKPGSLDELVERVVHNALGRDRTRSLAWSELMLHGALQHEGRTLAGTWYRELDAIWHDIQLIYDPSASPDTARAAVDRAVGMTMILRPLRLEDGALDSQLEKLVQENAPVFPRASRREIAAASAVTRRAQMRQNLVSTAIEIIASEGTRALSFGRLAEATNMVRSGPSYYFSNMGDLLSETRSILFDRAKQRYRTILSSAEPAEIDPHRLIDLTTTIFLREVMEFARENVGYYSIWLEGARNTALSPAIAKDVADLNLAWQRRLSAATGRPATAIDALRPQSLFTGKLFRSVAGVSSIEDLALARADFDAAIKRVLK